MGTGKIKVNLSLTRPTMVIKRQANYFIKMVNRSLTEGVG